MIEQFCRFCHSHHRVMLPLMAKLYDEGFVLEGRNADGAAVLNDALYAMRDDPAHAKKIIRKYQQSEGGEMALSLNGQCLIRLVYEESDWRFRLYLDLFDNNKTDLPLVQKKLTDAYDADDLESALSKAAEFLDEIAGEPLHYEICTRDKPFLAARLEERNFSLRLVDIVTYMRIVFFLMQKGDLTVMIRSPLDILRLLEELQEMITFMAESFADHDLTLEFVIEKQAVIRAGKGVKPTFGSRFGPTAIKIDALARILTSAMPGRGE